VVACGTFAQLAPPKYDTAATGTMIHNDPMQHSNDTMVLQGSVDMSSMAEPTGTMVFSGSDGVPSGTMVFHGDAPTEGGGFEAASGTMVFNSGAADTGTMVFNTAEVGPSGTMVFRGDNGGA